MSSITNAMLIFQKQSFNYANTEDLQDIRVQETFIDKHKNRIINLGDAFFYPPKYLQKNLNYVLVFSENTMKRDIPSGSVWNYYDENYRSEILRDDVGCGISMFLFKKENVALNEWLETISKKSIGGGNHFINIGEYDHDLDFLLLHSDFNNEKRIPRSVKEAQILEKQAKERRQETTQEILVELGIKGELYRDWPHNFVRTNDLGTSYFKGVVDTKENEGVGLLAMNPIKGTKLFVQNPALLNGYMQHGLGVKDHDFKKFYEEFMGNKKIQYLSADSSSKHQENISKSFNSYTSVENKFLGGAILTMNDLKHYLTIRTR